MFSNIPQPEKVFPGIEMEKLKLYTKLRRTFLITMIFNKLLQGQIPNDWKLAKLKLVYK